MADTPQRNQVAVRLRAVALEVAMQLPFPLGHRERVVRKCKVVHSDVLIVPRQKSADGITQHRNAVSGARQVLFGNSALRFEPLRQVGVGVQGDAVRPQLANLLNGSREALGVCLGSP
jgi:hypothetical protein